jgi:hypothetical protein
MRPVTPLLLALSLLAALALGCVAVDPEALATSTPALYRGPVTGGTTTPGLAPPFGGGTPDGCPSGRPDARAGIAVRPARLGHPEKVELLGRTPSIAGCQEPGDRPRAAINRQGLQRRIAVQDRSCSRSSASATSTS